MLPLLALTAVQLIDVAVHIAVGQVEPLRILGNAFLLTGGVFAALMPRLWTFTLAIGVVDYLILNALFLWMNGLTNPETDTARIPLFAFVALSMWFAFALWRARRSADAH